MKILELKKNFYYVGVVDHSLKVFDVAIRTDAGTSYNSYLLKTNEGTVIFEGCKKEFEEEYLAHIEHLCGLNDIKYLVVTHTEPDHSGAIKKLLSLNPNITVIASQTALKNLDNILRMPFKKIAMNPLSPLKIGEYTFNFVSGLLLHWPDVMFTYIKELKVLVSCDAFGAHYASDAILLSKEPNKEAYLEALKYYFANIMGPFGKFVSDACKRVSALDIDMIATGHGPVIDTNVKEQIALYDELAKEVTPNNDPNKVTIVYASCYGYTKEMALYLKERYEEGGKTVLFHEINILNYETEKPLIIKDILRSGTLLLGSPTLVGDAISLFYELLSHVTFTMGTGKVASAFGDYGWSGEAVKNLSDRLAELRFKVIPGFRYCFALDEEGKKALSDYFETIK